MSVRSSLVAKKKKLIWLKKENIRPKETGEQAIGLGQGPDGHISVPSSFACCFSCWCRPGRQQWLQSLDPCHQESQWQSCLSAGLTGVSVIVHCSREWNKSKNFTKYESIVNCSYSGALHFKPCFRYLQFCFSYSIWNEMFVTPTSANAGEDDSSRTGLEVSASPSRLPTAKKHTNQCWGSKWQPILKRCNLLEKNIFLLYISEFN